MGQIVLLRAKDLQAGQKPFHDGVTISVSEAGKGQMM